VLLAQFRQLPHGAFQGRFGRDHAPAFGRSRSSPVLVKPRALPTDQALKMRDALAQNPPVKIARIGRLDLQGTVTKGDQRRVVLIEHRDDIGEAATRFLPDRAATLRRLSGTEA
jgi:hypothetical protein